MIFVLSALLPPLKPLWFPDLGATLINVGAAAVPVGVMLRLRQVQAAGMGRPRPDRR